MALVSIAMTMFQEDDLFSCLNLNRALQDKISLSMQVKHITKRSTVVTFTCARK